MMNRIRRGIGVMSCLLLAGCGTPQLFPDSIMKGVETTFDFKAWQATPSAYQGRKVQLGGRILDAQPTDDGVLIVAKQLPIVEHPIYGPSDAKKRPGSFEFTFLYRGKVEPSALSPGNRFIVIGTTQGAKSVTVDGATRSAPSLFAQCMHIWKTGGRDIADFQSSGAGYEPLEENTYCSSQTEPG